MYYNATAHNSEKLKGTEFYRSRTENLNSQLELQDFGNKASSMMLNQMTVKAYNENGYVGEKIFTLNPSTETWDLV